MYNNKTYSKSALKALCKKRKGNGYGMTDLHIALKEKGIKISVAMLRRYDGATPPSGKDFSGQYSLLLALAICDVLGISIEEFIITCYKEKVF